MARLAPAAPARTESVASVLQAIAATAAISGVLVTILPALAGNAPAQAPPPSIKPPAKIYLMSAVRDSRAVTANVL